MEKALFSLSNTEKIFIYLKITDNKEKYSSKGY
jgi:hypothetical protein